MPALPEWFTRMFALVPLSLGVLFALVAALTAGFRALARRGMRVPQLASRVAGTAARRRAARCS
jgi:hypothetical protein